MAALSSSSAKRPKMEEMSILDPIRATIVCSSLGDVPAGVKKIGTHDGKFHCDEALAIAMLKFLPEWRDAAVVRTRDAPTLDACDIVVDVGGVYDLAAYRFDHHQKGFEEKLGLEHSAPRMAGFETCSKLSSAGLVYKHFGREAVAAVVAGDFGDDVKNNPWPAATAEVVYRKVYRSFIESIDAIDNGVSVCAGEACAGPAYRVTTDLSSRVGRLHPSWNQEQTSEIVNGCFREAMLLTGVEFIAQATGLSRSWWPARSLVETALAGAAAVDPSGRVMVLESGGLPWQSHVFDLEGEGAAPQGRLLFVLYTDNRGKWRVQAVPKEEGSFESRLKLASAWRGLRDEALSQACGVPGAVFVHAAGFIGGHETREGALAMAMKTIALNEEGSL